MIYFKAVIISTLLLLECECSVGRPALLVIDVQKCFIKGGSLAVPHAEDLIPIINDVISSYRQNFASIYFSLDSHPANHVSFVSQHDGMSLFDVVELRYNSKGENDRYIID